MKINLPPSFDAAQPLAVDAVGSSADGHLFALGTLLGGDPQPNPWLPGPETTEETRLVRLRLGMVSGLFAALCAKHPPTASHCLRVALGCSSWLLKTDVGEKERDEIEVAALLHDLGKLAVPDSILRKPSVLSSEEAALMTRHRQLGADILSTCCASPSILDVMKCTPAWFDGTRGTSGRRGREIPLGARMIAIVDAFDAMTTDHAYRRAMPCGRAIAELFENTGTQFDPDLVSPFASLYADCQVRLDASVARQWLQRLTVEQSNSVWQPGQPALSPFLAAGPDMTFQRELLQNMQDGVVFVDENLCIFFWNRGAERLTGTMATVACDRRWAPHIAGLQDIAGKALPDSECPVVHAIRCGSQVSQRYFIPRPGRRPISVEAHVVPVLAPTGTPCGATILLRDISSETTLQHRVQKLHKKATRDPLTWVANRAEFDRMHPELVRSHLEQSLPYSLIMCDIDHFKQVNDQYGHQAGDEALIRFAALLRQSCRHGDLVARYGGEEFVIMCADCGSRSAAERAEEIRCELVRTPLDELGGKGLTASFGVAELQPGDSAEAMLCRADRALFEAKRQGRNRVGAAERGQRWTRVARPHRLGGAATEGKPTDPRTTPVDVHPASRHGPKALAVSCRITARKSSRSTTTAWCCR